MSILLTRPEADSREVAEELAGIGLSSRTWPLTRIERVPGPADPPEGTDGLVFTSGNAVRAFAVTCAGRELPALCVGARTAELARGLGFADVRSADGDAEALSRLAAGSGLRQLFHPRGRDSRADLAALLSPAGARVADKVLYAAEPTGPPPPEIAAAFAAGEIRVVTLWSGRTAGIFREHWRQYPLCDPARLVGVAISRGAAAPLAGLGFWAIFTAEQPDRAAMVRAIRRADAALRR